MQWILCVATRQLLDKCLELSRWALYLETTLEFSVAGKTATRLKICRINWDPFTQFSPSFSNFENSTRNLDIQELDYNPSKKDLTDARIHHLLAEELKPYRRVSNHSLLHFRSLKCFVNKTLSKVKQWNLAVSFCTAHVLSNKTREFRYSLDFKIETLSFIMILIGNCIKLPLMNCSYFSFNH